MFRVIICGGSDFNDYNLLKNKCDYYLKNRIANGENVIVVSGGSEGADSLGEKYAKERGFNIERFTANWSKYGKRAGYLKNKQMAEVGNACIAFMSSYGENKSAKNMVSIARENRLTVREVKED